MQTQTLKNKPKVIYYKKDGYGLKMSSNWYVHKISEAQTFFYGPKIGDLRMGFYITMVGKKRNTYLTVAAQSAIHQKNQEEYHILEEEDLSNGNFKAFMRRASWYDPQANTMIFAREIFTESEDHVYILSSTIPNTPHLLELDRTIVTMMNSFHFVDS